MDIPKFEKNWTKWEPILLYLFFAVRFNLATFFWILPRFFVFMDLTISEFYYVLLLALSMFPLLMNLRMYVIVSPERRIFYRISKFLTNLMFGSIAYIMNLPLSPFSFSLIVILLIALILIMMIIDKIISRQSFFYFDRTMKVLVIFYISMIILSVLQPAPNIEWIIVFMMFVTLLLLVMVYNVIDASAKFIDFKK